MTPLDPFNADETRTLLLAPFRLFGAVAGADGQLDRKEWAALADGVRSQGLGEGLAGRLFAAVADNFDELRDAFKPTAPREGLEAVAKLLDRVAPEEAGTVKEALLALGLAVAEASGGRFGLGSPICGAERQALRDSARALGVHSRRAIGPGAGPLFTHILVPLDGSPAAEAALGPACDLADRFGAQVTLLEVTTDYLQSLALTTTEGVALDPAAFIHAAEEAKVAASDYLAGILATLQRPAWGTRVVQGDAASVIVEEAQACGADLIVVATQGSAGLKRLFESKVTEDVVRKARMPVLVIHVAEDLF